MQILYAQGYTVVEYNSYITIKCVHFDIASVGYRCIYWLDFLHDFVDTCGKFHLPLTCFHLYIVSSDV